MKSIYEIMKEINFEKEAENLEKEFYSLKDEVGISKFNREQLLFYILQKFYSKFNEPKQDPHKLNIEQKMALLEAAQNEIEKFRKYWQFCISQATHEVKYGESYYDMTLVFRNFEIAEKSFKNALLLINGL